jgi:ephrin receptor-like protein
MHICVRLLHRHNDRSTRSAASHISYHNNFPRLPADPDCAACDPGFCHFNSCTPCNAGTYSNGSRATSCRPCAPNEYSLKGASNCTLCDPGTEGNDLRTQCSPCRPGSFNPFIGASCHLCSRGSFQPYYGQFTCLVCGKGRFSDELGRRLPCEPCPSGLYCPDQQTVVPAKCPKDHYCPAGSYEPKKCPGLHASGRGASVRVSSFQSIVLGFRFCAACGLEFLLLA